MALYQRAAPTPFRNLLRIVQTPHPLHALDGSRVMGTNSVEFEVLFKGRFSDVGLPGYAPS
jgi:hypothetical protein